MRTLKKNLRSVPVALGLVLCFGGCINKHSFEKFLGGAGSQRQDAPGQQIQPAEVECNNFRDLIAPLKVILVVENSAAAEAMDDKKKNRAQILAKLISQSSTQTNFSWMVLGFHDTSANALTAVNANGIPQFVSPEDALTAVNDYENSAVGGGGSPYKAALDFIGNAIRNDPDFLNAQSANYTILFLAADAPSDFGAPLDANAFVTAVQNEAGLLPGNIAINFYYLGSNLSTDAQAMFNSAASTAYGRFSNSTLPSDFGLESVASVPHSVCLDPIQPLACPSESREVLGPAFMESVACGTGGTKTITYATAITQSCSMGNNAFQWTEVATTKQKQSEGECLGQYCSLDDGTNLADKANRTFYSNETPKESCAMISQVRTCVNGKLDGSATYSKLNCLSGCGEFGVNGTTKIGVVGGEIVAPVACTFGEPGVTNKYQQLVDQKCDNGSIQVLNTYQGNLLSAGVCPTYQWVGSATWTACSANCGGTQNRVFECRDNLGSLAPSERCTLAMPVETQVCDGNPAAAAYSSVATTREQGTQSACPANQIGVSVMVRDVTTTQNYACINHQVSLANTDVVNGPWTTESYCRNYVAHRCSQDSLSNVQADGRYQWMQKCQNQVPAIKEFLDQFGNVKVSGNYTINSNGRHLYPTFMDTATKPEKPWKAPISPQASCAVPSTAYIATVCLSSCSTPEQLILVEVPNSSKAEFTDIPFIEAVTKNLRFVATLKPGSSMQDKAIIKTHVQEWVTELIDTEHDILEFRMRSGGTLRVTLNHPIVAENGTMKLAGDFRVGDNLVRLGGQLDPIDEIVHQQYYGKVYNLFTSSSLLEKNIVITNGYLNGSAFYQNEGANHINRSLFRQNLIRGVFNK